jgi:hypothetical protein
VLHAHAVRPVQDTTPAAAAAAIVPCRSCQCNCRCASCRWVPLQDRTGLGHRGDGRQALPGAAPGPQQPRSGHPLTHDALAPSRGAAVGALGPPARCWGHSPQLVTTARSELWLRSPPLLPGSPAPPWPHHHTCCAAASAAGIFLRLLPPLFAAGAAASLLASSATRSMGWTAGWGTPHSIRLAACYSRRTADAAMEGSFPASDAERGLIDGAAAT